LRNRSEPTLPNLVSLLKHSEVLYHLLYMMGILVVRGLWNSARSFQGPSRVSESRPGIALIGAIADSLCWSTRLLFDPRNWAYFC